MEILDIILSLGPWILDKIFPSISKKIIPPVEITPKNFKLGKGDWSEQISFSVKNKGNASLFDVYIMIDIGKAKSENLKIRMDGSREVENENINENILINTKFIKFNITTENNQDFILLKVSRIEPYENILFKITANLNDTINLKVLKWSKEQSNVLFNKDNGKVALTFEIPINPGKDTKFSIKSVSFFLRRK